MYVIHQKHIKAHFPNNIYQIQHGLQILHFNQITVIMVPLLKRMFSCKLLVVIFLLSAITNVAKAGGCRDDRDCTDPRYPICRLGEVRSCSFWFPGPWTRVTSVVSLTTATATTAAMFPNPNF